MKHATLLFTVQADVVLYTIMMNITTTTQLGKRFRFFCITKQQTFFFCLWLSHFKQFLSIAIKRVECLTFHAKIHTHKKKQQRNLLVEHNRWKINKFVKFKLKYVLERRKSDYYRMEMQADASLI